MTPQERATQVRVGIFMTIGLCIIAGMVVYFGRFGETVRKYYHVTVEYPNAGGLLKSSSVLLAGAKVGVVEDSPVILPDMDGVSVKMAIYEEVRIPSGAIFTIGSTGLLGDKFVQINVPHKVRDTPPIEPGAIIKGKSETSMSDLFDQIGPFIGEMRDTGNKINSMATKLDDRLLKEETINNFQDTLANLKATTASFAESSKKINDVIDKAKSVLDTGNQAMVSTKSAADELKKTIGDVHTIVLQTKQGRGALGLLLSNQETAENLRALVENLRRNGILFYKNTSAPR